MVTSAVTDWYTTPSSNYGLVLLATGADQGEVKFDSRTGDAGQEPRLRLTYRVPTAGGCSGTVSLADVADTYIQEDSDGNDNFGDAPTLKVRPQSTKHKHALLKFDVGGIPVGATLNAATFKVNVKTAKTNTASGIYGMTTDWTEGTNSAATGASWDDPNGTGTAGTWANGTGFGSGDYSPALIGTITPNLKGFKTADVKTLVQAWQNTPANNKGLVLLTTGTSTADAEYRSREDGDAANRPVIDVSWTIPPANATQVNTMTAGPLMAVEGDQINVKMVLQNNSTSAVTGVTPSGLTVTPAGGGTYSCATLTGPSPASQTVPANGSATFTWACTTSTTPTAPGTLAFSATASGSGGVTWASSITASVIVSPPLVFKADVKASPGVPVVTNEADMNLAFPSTVGSVCYVVADGFGANDVDYLRQVDRATGAVTPANPTATGTQSIEAMTWSLDYTTLFAVNANQFGTLNTTTGLFTGKAATVASAADPMQGEFGNLTVADVDGISFDPATGVLYGVSRRETGALLDVLIKIDPVTGKHINNAFGTGVDYIKIPTNTLTGTLYDVDDIAFDPITGDLYALANATAANPSILDRLIIVDKGTGAVTDVGLITKSTGGDLDDVEGLSFYGDGGLYASTGFASTPIADANKLYALDKQTAIATQVAVLGADATYNDYEAIACQGGSLSTSSSTSNEVETSLSASIGDRVWADVDGDGVQDAGEPGLVGVEVCATPTAGGAALCHTTDAFGIYRIYGLTNATSYNVTLTPATIPAGYAPTTAGVLTRTATLAGVNDADFGLQPKTGINPEDASSIGDTVWNDADRDGVVDSGETRLADITVKLYSDTNNNGVIDAGDVLVATTATDVNGNYLFGTLNKGNYLVDVDETDPQFPAGLNLVTGGSPITSPPANGLHDVDIAAFSTNVLTADFGYAYPGVIGDFVWYDKDFDNVQDGPSSGCVPSNPTDECGAPNATVVLIPDTNGNGVAEPELGENPIATYVTDSTGFYQFTNLPLGKYVVQVSEQEIPSPVTGNVNVMVPTSNGNKAVELTLGAPTNNNVDFGFAERAKIEGHVFRDVNGNGVLESGEAVIGSVTVTLTGTDLNGNPVSQTTTTGACPGATCGEYAFLVPAGNYSITYDTADTDIPADIRGTAGTATTPTTINLTVIAGTEYTGNDFGRDNKGSIGDRVWNDANNNGIQTAGELGIAGVTVQLYASDGTTLLATTVSDASGNYSFPGLADGTNAYVVKIPASNFATGGPLNGFAATGEGDPGTACGGGCDNSITASVTGGAANNSVDFGYYKAGYAVSGNVWNDNGGGTPANAGNGVKNSGEPNIPGVTVTLYKDTNNNNLYDAGDVVFATAITDGSGNYSFPGVPNGDYVVVVDPGTLPSPAFSQTGDPDGTLNNESEVTVSGSNPPAENFGYRAQYGSLSGTVVEGLNGNGLADPGEVPFPNVPVYLTWAGPDGYLGTADDVTVSVVTDASGNYTFDATTITSGPLNDGLPPGLYEITKTNPSGYDSLADADGGNPNNISVTLANGQNKADQDFEVAVPDPVIGDRIWLDENSNGVQDAGEAGIANVMVRLWAAGPDALLGTPDDVLAGEKVTDTNGNYLFTGLDPNTSYLVKVVTSTLSAGLSANPTYDVDGIGTPHQAVANTGSGEGNFDADFGYNWAPAGNVTGGTGNGAIGDRVWSDDDGDGVQDPAEAGLGGVPVAIYYDSNNDGVVDALYTLAKDQNGATGTGTTTTNADGSYVFSDLPKGIYSIVVNGGVAPAGYTQTGDPDASNDNQTTTPIVLAPGDVFVNADFGYQPPAAQDNSVSGVVFMDLNVSGTKDTPPDTLVPGVTVALIRDSNGNGTWETGEPIVATTVTASDGSYAFSGLPDGKYIVWVNDTANVLNPVDFKITVDPDNSSPKNNLVAVDLDSGGASATPVVVGNQDFGYTPKTQDAGEGLIGDSVFLDRNGNGTFDPGEGLEGVVVRLYQSDGSTLVANTTTDENGHYYFGNLTATATYVVKVDTTTLPNGGTGLTNTVDPESNSDSQSSRNLTVVGAIDLAADFGYRVLTSPNTISGTIWTDTDANGTLGGAESGRYAGVTVELRDANGNLVATATTDASGNYSFAGLPNGTYSVDVTDAGNVLNGLWKSTGPTPGADNNSQVDPYTLTVTGGANNTTADFGFYGAPASLGDFVWNDLDGDGIQETGELGLSGVQVKLVITWPGAGGTTTLLTLTDSSGLYAFDNLLLDENLDGAGAGEPTYVISIPVLPGTASPQNATTEGLDSDNSAGEAATATEGAFNDIYDFGFTNVQSATIRGTVYDDGGFGSTGNGAFGGSPADVPVGGVVVSLYRDLNNDGIAQPTELVTTAVTAPDGSYSFPGVTNGNYLVVETDPAGATSVADTQGANDNKIALTLTGTDSIGNSFLDDGTTTAAISGFVYDDAGFGVPGNGGFGGSPSDAPIAGVVVALYRDTNNDGIPQPGELVTSTVTAADGSYSFPTLPSGNYLLIETDPSGATSTADTQGLATDNKVAVTLTGTNSTGNNFLDDGTTTAAISGVVYDDGGFGVAGDSAFGGTPADAPIPGVVISLYRDLNIDGLAQPTELLDTTATDGTGAYSFPNLPSAKYLVVETDPAGVTSKLDSDNANPPATATDNKVAVTLTGTNQSGNDFLDDGGTNTYTYTVSGAVKNDADLSGGFTGADTPLNGVTVALYADLNNNGVVDPGEPLVDTDTTDASGNYSFPNVPNGNYLVVETDPNGYSSVTDFDGVSNGANLIDVTVSGGNQAGKDFLDRATAATGIIGNYVWLDEDGDGVQDAGEAGIANLTVTLTGTDSLGNPVSRTTVTDADGGYQFAALPPSNGSGYTITVTPTAGLNATYNEDTGTTTPDNATIVVLAAGVEHLTADFGYNWAPSTDVTGNTGTGAIGDRVWVDADGDGVQDPGEPGLAGVTVTLTGLGADGILGTGDDTTATKITAADGSYVFDGLVAGAYSVSVTSGTTGYIQTGDPDATLDGKTTAPLLLGPGDVYVNADFGYQPTTAVTGTVSGTLWFDADSDQQGPAGTPGGTDVEPTLAGVTVALIQDSNGNGLWDAGEPIVATDITDAAGNYSFPGLPAGSGQDYLVWVNDTDAVVAGLTPTYDSNGTGTPNISAVTNLTSGGNADQDFGYTAPDATPGVPGTGVIGDTIFLDRNNNNTANVGEGIQGVTVRLYNAAGTTLVATTTTDANGLYAFGGLADATYTVKVDTTTLPGTVGQLTNTYDPDSGTASQSSVVIFGGNVDLAQDFGYQDLTAPNTIQGTIWNDTNADGTLGVGETVEYAGVTVVLKDSDGNIVATTVTDINGDYSFAGLPDGTFKVDVTDDANVLNGLWHSLGTAGTDGQSQSDPYTVAVSGGNTYPADFGYYGAPGALGNRVWGDDGDGIQEPGEIGLPNVQVTLTTAWPNGTTSTLVTTTDANGNYSFGNLLLDENYRASTTGDPATTGLPKLTITVATPAGGTVTAIGAGGNPALDSNNPAGTVAEVTEGQVNDTYDFGYTGVGTVTGRVYRDANGNGVFDAGDVPQGNVTVTITDSNSVVHTVTTDSNGLFSETVPAGATTVNVDESTLTGITNPTLTTNVSGEGSDPTVVNVPAGGTGTDNTGYVSNTQQQSVTGKVYKDLDGSGTFNAGDVPQVGAKVVITDSNGGVYTVTTNGTGDFTQAVPAGATTVNVQESTLSITNPTLTTNASGEGTDPTVVTVPAGGTANDNTGYVANATSQNVTGRVYEDVNGNGVYDGGDIPQVGAKVVITASNGGVYNATTDGNGVYLQAVPPGATTVNVDETTLSIGTPALTTNASGDGTDPTIVNVPSGGTGTDNTGYVTQANVTKVTGHLYIDTNGNGTQDGGEPNLANVDVRITPASGAPFTVSTDANGNWTATVPPGSTMADVQETDPQYPAGYVQTEGTDPTTVTAVLGASTLTDNDGYAPTWDIGDRVWYDTDKDGIQDPDEPGIFNVAVSLSGTNGKGQPVNLSTVTDGSGAYAFPDLLPGTYTVTFTAPSGYTITQKDATGSLTTLADSFDSDADPGTGATPAVVLTGNNPTIDAGMYLPDNDGPRTHQRPRLVRHQRQRHPGYG